MFEDAVILNSKGEPILLNEREKRIAQINQTLMNNLGYEISITTLTTVTKKISEQKFFTMDVGGNIPMIPGEGAWTSNLLSYRSFDASDDFSTGIINTGENNDRMASASTAIDSVSTKIYNWAKKLNWSLPQLEEASKSGNWDLVTSLEEARKRNWDLGIQKVAYLGLTGDSNVLGLLNQTGATVDTDTLPQPISTLGAIDLKQFVSVMLNVYRANCGRSAWPTHFAIPESDYLGLVGQASADFPIKSTLELLLEAFQVATGNKNFKIVSCAYGDVAYSGFAYQNYALYNYDEKSLKMNVPVPYTNTLANSSDNFNFQNVGYGQFAGVTLLRPLELYYFQFNP